MTRRDLLRIGSVSAYCGTSVMVSGCSLLQRQNPSVNIRNDDSKKHKASVAIQRVNGETLLDKNITLGSNELVDYSDVLPRTDNRDGDKIEIETIVKLGSGFSKRQTDELAPELHELSINIVSSDSIVITQSVY